MEFANSNSSSSMNAEICLTLDKNSVQKVHLTPNFWGKWNGRSQADSRHEVDEKDVGDDERKIYDFF